MQSHLLCRTSIFLLCLLIIAIVRRQNDHHSSVTEANFSVILWSSSSHFHKLVFARNRIAEKTYPLRNRLLAVRRYLKLHVPQATLDAAHRFSHFGPAVTLRNGLLTLVMEAHESLHHVFSLPHGTELIVITVSILL